jgi:hypothetical protein
MLNAQTLAVIWGIMLLGGGCVCKDTLVIGYEKRGGFGSINAPYDGPCTLWPKRAWNDAAFGRPFWVSIDEPWKAQRLITIEVRQGESVGFRRGFNGQVVAFAGKSELALPEDDYGWYRPKVGGEAVVEGGVLAPVRFVAGSVVVGAVAGAAVVGTGGELKIHRH